MSKSKLHVLDLMVCAKYLNDNDIFKLKYVSKSFEDIQDRILINYNPFYLGLFKDIQIKFPNIQTVQIYDDVLTINYKEFEIINIAKCIINNFNNFDYSRLSNACIVNLILFIYPEHFNLGDFDIMSLCKIIDNYLKLFECKFNIWLYHPYKPSSQIIKLDKIVCYINQAKLVMNISQIVQYNYNKNNNYYIKEIIVECNDFPVLQKKITILNNIDYVFKNFKKFDYELHYDLDTIKSTITFENCDLITSDLPETIKYNFINCKQIETPLDSKNFKIFGHVPKMNIKLNLINKYPYGEYILPELKDMAKKYYQHDINFNNCYDFLNLFNVINKEYKGFYKFDFEILNSDFNEIHINYCIVLENNNVKLTIPLNLNIKISPYLLHLILINYENTINDNHVNALINH